MNIKIKSAGVSCLISEDYNRVFAALKKQLGEGPELLFTERTPGHEYLQWELPGEGWTSLADGDPLMAQEVRRELLVRQKAVLDRFGSNQDMAQRVLSVPDDSYVYYRADADGRLLIKLTVWGYRYPERVTTSNLQGVAKPEEQTEHVTITVIYAGQPLPGKPFLLNKFQRATGATGTYDAGELPVGYQFDVEVDGRREHVAVMPGRGHIEIDTTVMTTIDVVVTQNDQPLGEAKARVDYMGRQLELTTDATGRASATMPLDPEAGLCSVTVESQTQQLLLKLEPTTFTFNLVKEEEEPPVPPIDEDPDLWSHDGDDKKDDSDEEKKEESDEEKKDDGEEEQKNDGEEEKKDDTDDEKKDDTAEEEQSDDAEKTPEPPAEPDEKTSPLTYLFEALSVLALAALVFLTYCFSLALIFA